MGSHRLALIAGDGIGPEVVAEAVKVLEAAAGRFGFAMQWSRHNLGADSYLATGEVLPASILEELRGADAILLGAVGRPDVPPGVLERGLLLRLRAELGTYVNLRPVRLLPGVTSPLRDVGPGELDLLIVRENSEGGYAGVGGTLAGGSDSEVATEVSVNTRAGVERCVRYAAARAAERSGVVTLVHKTNVLTFAGSLWRRCAEEVAAETGVRLAYEHVDAACLHMVADPGRYDVIVTDNLFGDILSDLGAALAGGLGFAPSANLNPTREGPSLFEPVHGSAPDIAGQGKANPVAAILSAALLLDHLGERLAAAAVEQAVIASLSRGQAAGTAELGDRIAAALTDADPDAGS